MSSTNQIIQQVYYARMRIISKSPDQTRQAARDVGPVIKGDGNTTYLCGDYETTVLETVVPSQASTLFHVQVRHLKLSGV
jgi:hypothetical protein